MSYGLPRENPRKVGGASKVVEYIDAESNRRKAESILAILGNLRLNGDTGVGKSTFIHWLCQENNWSDPFEYSLTTDTDRWALVAQDILRDGSSQVRPGVILEWLMFKPDPDDRAILFLDEFNYAQANVTTLMNQLTDFRRSLWVPELAGSDELKDMVANSDKYPSWPDYKTGETRYLVDPKDPKPLLHRSPSHFVVIAMNPAEKAGYTGAGAMNIAQLRRFESLWLNYLKKQDELSVVGKAAPKCPIDTRRKLVAIAQDSRPLYDATILCTPITTGNVINYARMMTPPPDGPGLTDEEIGTIMAAMYLDQERQAILRLWNGEQSAKDLMEEHSDQGGMVR